MPAFPQEAGTSLEGLPVLTNRRLSSYDKDLETLLQECETTCVGLQNTFCQQLLQVSSTHLQSGAQFTTNSTVRKIDKAKSR